MPGWSLDGGWSSCAEPGRILANAVCKSRFKIGCASDTGSQPSGGEAGGEIKNCFSNAGGFSKSLDDVFEICI